MGYCDRWPPICHSSILPPKLPAPHYHSAYPLLVGMLFPFQISSYGHGVPGLHWESHRAGKVREFGFNSGRWNRIEYFKWQHEGRRQKNTVEITGFSGFLIWKIFFGFCIFFRLFNIDKKASGSSCVWRSRVLVLNAKGNSNNFLPIRPGPNLKVYSPVRCHYCRAWMSMGESQLWGKEDPRYFPNLSAGHWPSGVEMHISIFLSVTPCCHVPSAPGV